MIKVSRVDQGKDEWSMDPIYMNTVEHIYDACPKYSELGSFRIIAYLYVSDSSRC